MTTSINAIPLGASIGTSSGQLSYQLGSMSNRHGLVTGATGTGKTVTLQVLAEGFARMGVPVFAADIKGDLSGIAKAGKSHPKIDERLAQIPLTDYEFASLETVFWDIFGENGHPIRTTISEMGPLLLANLLELNETQTGVLYACFRIADDQGLLLLDLKDLRAMLNWMGEHKKELQVEYGNLASATLAAISRKLLVLEEQGAGEFFGEPALDIKDFIKQDKTGKGIIHLLDATRLVHESPKLYCTFLLWLLSELFEELPEAGDSDKPKMVFFFDEAHLLFDQASKPLLQKIEQVVRLIRSKGVGIFFITQNPNDIPDSILGQLGLKVQHALRAFTAKDRKAIKTAAQNFPESEHYEVAELLTQMGIGEALVTVLSEKGMPTPLVHTYLRAPQSRMDVLTDTEINAIIEKSILAKKYNEEIDRESAYEILNAKIEGFNANLAAAEDDKAAEKEAKAEAKEEEKQRKLDEKEAKKAAAAKSKIMGSVGKEVANVAVRGLLGAFGIKTRKRKFF